MANSPTELTWQRAFERAIAHHRSGELAEAESIYRQILAHDSDQGGTINLLAQLFHQTGRGSEAADLLRQAIKVNPSVPDYHANLGVILASGGNFTEAIPAFRSAVRLSPQAAEAHYNLANALKGTGQLDEAISEYRAAISRRPDFAPAWNNLGNVLTMQQQFDEAIEALHRGISLRPNSAEAHYNLGNALKSKGQLDAAISEYRVAISLRPNYAEAHSNLGSALHATGRLNEAVTCCRQAIALKPNLADAHGNLGNALKETRQLPEAIRAYETAHSLRPDDPHLHWNLAFALLMNGDYDRGWPAYESRFRTSDYVDSHMNFPQLRWDGSELGGRRILLRFEQGFGDMIQFVRFAPLVAKRGGRVIALGPPELKRLIEGQCGIEQFVTPDEPLPDFDVYCPLLSLPLLFKTTLQTIPTDVPYVSAPSRLVEQWRTRVAQLPAGLKVGLVWAGSPSQSNDRRRSFPLQTLAPLAEVAGVNFISLQKGPKSAELQSPPPGLNIVDGTSELNDFADTAALMANLDLIIASDTSVTHLAGAMGKPTWQLTCHIPDWRWMLDRTDCPWYPTHRLFRQPAAGDWATPVRQITDALINHRTSI